MQDVRFAAQAVLVAISLGSVAPSLSNADDLGCVGRFERPIYPPLARQASLQGTVRVHVTIGPNGVPKGTYEGTQILVQAVQASVERTRLDPSCEGKSYDLSYRFELEGEGSLQPMTTMSFIPPAEYLISSNPTGIICILRSEIAPKRKPKAPVAARR